MQTKICKRCGNDLPHSDFYMSSKKYVVGGVVKAIHGSLRTLCKKCTKEVYHPPGWHLKYKKIGSC